MEQGLLDRGDGEELIDTKVVDVHFDGQPTTTLPSMPLVCNVGISLLIKR